MTTNGTGRLASLPNETLTLKFELPKLERELRQFEEIITVDFAHLVMLVEQGILTKDHGKRLALALREAELVGSESFPVDPFKGSFLSQLELFIISKVGENVGGRLHTARSRIDYGATIRRLYKKKRMFEAFENMNYLSSIFILESRKHVNTIMPGYTCLQHAQPTTYAHYLLSFASKVDDDYERLMDAYKRVNLSPLGAVGLSGTSWPIDRNRTCELLGFAEVLQNSKLAREAYYAADIASALSFLMSTLNDLATDLHIWSSYEFAMIETADQFCATSSIFPQKKNPVGLEAIRYAAGPATSWLSEALATFRAEGTADVSMRELPMVDRMLETTGSCLRLMGEIIPTTKIDVERMKNLAGANWSTASNLADTLVRECDISYREAHHLVGRLVRDAIASKIPVSEVSLEMLRNASAAVGLKSVEISSRTLRESLDPATFVATRTSTGAVSSSEVSNLIKVAESKLLIRRAWHREEINKMKRSTEKLAKSVDRIIS